MRLAVREKPIEDETQNREQKHDDTPEQLVCDRAVGLENLHYESLLAPFPFHRTTPLGLTEDNDIKNQHDESHNSTTSTVLPSIAVAGCNDRLFCHGEGEEAELQKQVGECGLKHFLLIAWGFWL
jgi:hypothetical protein